MLIFIKGVGSGLSIAMRLLDVIYYNMLVFSKLFDNDENVHCNFVNNSRITKAWVLKP